MRDINKLTVALGCVFVVTLITSVSTLRGAGQDSAGLRVNDVAAQEGGKIKGRFPVTEMDAPEDSDPAKRERRKEKGRRYDGSWFVSREPPVEGEEIVFYTDWYGDAPALPVNESMAIVVGTVTGSEAHLSNDKSGIYTEFTVRVSEVLKSVDSTLTADREISVDRPGGFVRYLDSRKVLYRYSGMNMPAVGGEYVFFLKAPEPNQNYGLLTGYELSPQGVTPLDATRVFEPYRGKSKATFLSSVREAVNRSRP